MDSTETKSLGTIADYRAALDELGWQFVFDDSTGQFRAMSPEPFRDLSAFGAMVNALLDPDYPSIVKRAAEGAGLWRRTNPPTEFPWT